jgi:hypothetical protein
VISLAIALIPGPTTSIQIIMVLEDFVSSRSGNLQIKMKLRQREDSRTLVFVADKWKTRQTPDSYKIPLVRALNCIILHSSTYPDSFSFKDRCICITPDLSSQDGSDSSRLADKSSHPLDTPSIGWTSKAIELQKLSLNRSLWSIFLAAQITRPSPVFS